MTSWRTLLSTIGANMPNVLQWSFPGGGVKVDEANGHPTGSWVDAAPPAPLSGGSTVTWVNGVGLRVKWLTGFTYLGNVVTGATFFVPMCNNVYEGAGNINDSNISAIQTACNTFVAAAHLRVYSRPSARGPGASFPVLGVTVPDRVSWLRGRRT